MEALDLAHSAKHLAYHFALQTRGDVLAAFNAPNTAFYDALVQMHAGLPVDLAFDSLCRCGTPGYMDQCDEGSPCNECKYRVDYDR